MAHLLICSHSVLKAYFATLGDSAHPESSDPRVRQITNFQELCELELPELPKLSIYVH